MTTSSNRHNTQLRIAWCHNGVIGGAKRAAYAMVRELTTRGHVVDEFILCDEPSDYLPLTGLVGKTEQVVVGRRSYHHLRPYVLNTYGQFFGYISRRPQVERLYQQMAETINAGGYDVAHLDQHPFCHTLGLLPYLRIPSVVYIHAGSGAGHTMTDLQPKANGHEGLKRWYTQSCEQALAWKDQLKQSVEHQRLQRASLLLANSDFSRETFFQTFGSLPTTCHLGVDTEVFHPLGLAVEPMVLSVGRLVWMKQHHIVIEAVGRMERASRPRVVVATPEAEANAVEASLRQLAQPLGVELSVVHAPSQEALVRLYNQALALVAVSVMEPLGLVVLESMACGTPAIGVREGGIREIIAHDETGLLVERDARQIAEAIATIQQHPELRARMSQQAVDAIRSHWTWTHAVDRYEHAIQGLLTNGQQMSHTVQMAGGAHA